MNKIFCLLLIVACLGCEKNPDPIQYGKDQCEFCKMTISDPQFGAEIISDKGRIYKFDAIECLIRFIKSSDPKSSDILITPYNQPTKLIPKDSLVFLLSSQIKSPMGAGLAAMPNKNSVDSVFGRSEPVYTWNDVYAKIK